MVQILKWAIALLLVVEVLVTATLAVTMSDLLRAAMPFTVVAVVDTVLTTAAPLVVLALSVVMAAQVVTPDQMDLPPAVVAAVVVTKPVVVATESVG